MKVKMQYVFWPLVVHLFLGNPCYADNPTQFERLVNGSGGTLEEVFPEADLVCVVGQYSSTRRILEPYNVGISFWADTVVFENEVLLILVKDSKVFLEQRRDTIPKKYDGEVFFLLPENTCFQELDARVEVTTRLSKPIYETIDGEKEVRFPSLPYKIVKIIQQN